MIKDFDVEKRQPLNNNKSAHIKYLSIFLLLSMILSGCSNGKSESKTDKTSRDEKADIHNLQKKIESCNLLTMNQIWLNKDYTDLEKKKTYPGVVLSAYLFQGTGGLELVKLQKLKTEISNLKAKLSSFDGMEKFYILGSIDNLGSLNLFYYKARLSGNRSDFFVATRNNLFNGGFYYKKEFCSSNLKLFDNYVEKERVCDDNGCEELTKPVAVYKASDIFSCNIPSLRNKLTHDRAELVNEIRRLTYTYAYLLATYQLHKNISTKQCEGAWNAAYKDYQGFQAKYYNNYYSTIGDNIAENGVVRYMLANPKLMPSPKDKNFIPIRFARNKITYLQTSPRDDNQFYINAKTPCTIGSTTSNYTYWDGIQASLLKNINHNNPLLKNYKLIMSGNFDPTSIFLGVNNKAAKFCVDKSGNPQIIFKHFNKTAMPNVGSKSCKIVYSAYYEHGKELKRQMAGNKMHDKALSPMQLIEYKDLPNFNYQELRHVVNKIPKGSEFPDNRDGVFQGIVNSHPNNRILANGKYGFPYFSDMVCQSKKNNALYKKLSEKTKIILKKEFINKSGEQPVNNATAVHILNSDSLSCAKYFQNLIVFKNSNYNSCIVKKTTSYLAALSNSPHEKASLISERNEGNKLIYDQKQLVKKLVRYGIVPKYSLKVPLNFEQYEGDCLLKAGEDTSYLEGYLYGYNLQACKDRVLLKGLDHLKSLLIKNSGKVKADSSFTSNTKNVHHHFYKNFPQTVGNSKLIKKLKIYVRDTKHGVLITRVVSKHNEFLGLHKGEVIYNIIYYHDNHFVKNVSQLVKLVNSLHYHYIFIVTRIGKGPPYKGYNVDLFVK